MSLLKEVVHVLVTTPFVTVDMSSNAEPVDSALPSTRDATPVKIVWMDQTSRDAVGADR